MNFFTNFDLNKFNDIATSSLDEWIYYLKNNSLPTNFSAKGLEEVKEILNYQDMDEQAKIDYDGHLKSLAISNNVIETAMLEGKLLGEATGEARGEARGIAISEAKALTEKEVVVCNTFKH